MGIATAARREGLAVEALCFFLPSARPGAFPFALVFGHFFAGLDESIGTSLVDFFAGLDEITELLGLAEFSAGLGEPIVALLGPAVGWMSAGR
jgi:hypothetical protein